MAKILYALDPAGTPTKTATVDLPSLRYTRERATMRDPDGAKLATLFGEGFMEHVFHLVTENGLMLKNCEMSHFGGHTDLEHDGQTTAYPPEWLSR
jgi:hypothetical protein